MPDLPIVDSHLHIWDPTRFRMPWLDGNRCIGKPFGLTDYAEHTRGLDIQAMVYLEVDVAPHYTLLEARWAVERAQDDPRLAAVVAHAPVEYGEHVRAYLSELVALGPLVKGVRRLIQGEREPGFCTQPAFVRGVQIVGEHGLSFDICIVHPQMASAIELVRQCPDVRFVLDHLGKPGIRDGLRDPWRGQIRELAQLPNIVCKISGAVTEATHDAWTIEDLKPYVSDALDAFGEDRVLFGGDWPVVLTAASYRRWVDALDELTVSLSDQARRKLWADNARRVYRL